MRNAIIAILLNLCSQLNAQDTIVKTNGDAIRAKVRNITTQNVKYFNRGDGLVYTIPLNEVYEVKYADGTTYFTGAKKPGEKTPPVVITKYDSLMNLSRLNKRHGTGACAGGSVVIALSVPLFVIAHAEAVSQSSLSGTSLGGVSSLSITLEYISATLVLASGIATTITGTIQILKSKRQRAAAMECKPVAYLSMPAPVMMAQGGYKGLGVGWQCRF